MGGYTILVLGCESKSCKCHTGSYTGITAPLCKIIPIDWYAQVPYPLTCPPISDRYVDLMPRSYYAIALF